MKLAHHIRRLMVLGCPQKILRSPRTVQYYLNLNGVSASRNHIRAALNRHATFILNACY